MYISFINKLCLNQGSRQNSYVPFLMIWIGWESYAIMRHPGYNAAL